MREFFSGKTLLLSSVLALMLLLPLTFVSRIRRVAIECAAPLWKWVALPGSAYRRASSEAHKRLELENNRLCQLLVRYKRELDLCKKQAHGSSESAIASPVAITARPLYWDCKGSGHFLWIDVGTSHNRLKKQLIAQNSPVLFGATVVGVIDQVGSHSSRVRLLSDPALHPSVQAVRGSHRDALMLDHVEAVIERVSREEGAFGLSAQHSKCLQTLLQRMRRGLSEGLAAKGASWYFARGILQGSKGAGLLRHSLVKGLGFTSSYAEEARIALGDILVTTGLDGLFPAGLVVAEVVRIFPVEEGEPTFEFEARLSFQGWDSATALFVLPPLPSAV